MLIKSLKLINFRNFSEKIINNFENKTYIIGENGKGKTNILEALSLLLNNSLTGLNLDDLIKKGETYFFIEYEIDTGKTFSFSYTKEKRKKLFMINQTKVSKKIFIQDSYNSVNFSPIHMNLMYLSPNLRRSFLDEILINSFPEYEKIHKIYINILKNRNKILKNINIGKSNITELDFWNKQFIENSKIIYKYRFKIIDFLQKGIKSTLEYFGGKINNIDIIYNSKIDKNNITKSINLYIKNNIDLDIILGRTTIGPHIDDFNIKVDGINLINYASRGETKSIIIYLKLLEGIFIEKMTGKKPILLIDDLFSELDKNHKDMLIKKIQYYQAFITSIIPIGSKKYIKL